MQKPKHIVLVAGEESGDMHAAQLVKQLKSAYPDIRISGIGGRHMQAAGVELVADLARYGVTGFTAVFRYLRVIREALKGIKQHLHTVKPDMLILIDYPGFNLRLAKFARQQAGLKIIYYISPQIWAWKAKRIHLIKQCVDQMAVILPFEKEIYQQALVPAQFVGHPLIESMARVADKTSCRKLLSLPENKRLIALLPGSRTNEIERHMPVLRDTAKQLYQHDSNHHFVIPIAGTLKPAKIKAYFENSDLPVTFVESKALECMSAADFVIVASGTASLECALLKKPMCIIYKTSALTYYLGMRLIKVRFLGLCNLLMSKMVVSEFLQYDCNADELARFILTMQQNPHLEQHMVEQLSALNTSLSASKADCSLLQLVVSQMPE